MQIIDGNALAQTIKQEIAEEVKALNASGGKIPYLVAVLVGDNPASQSYVRGKAKSCDEAGFISKVIKRPADISQEEVLALVKELNEDEEVDGFIVQLPLPEHIDADTVTLAIDPAKDVDGFHPVNFGKMAQGLPAFLPATPYGILQMLERYHIETDGKHCVVVGRSNIVGMPISILLAQKSQPGNCTVTLTHSRTQDLPSILQSADIIIAAIGRPHFITAEMVKEGAVVIDVGINRVEDASKKRGYRLVGDVDYEGVAPKCSYITPVPGGVGPMTVTSLMLNTLAAAKKKA